MSRFDIFDDDDDENTSCPNGGDHDASQCFRYGYQNYIAELEALAPCGTSRQGLREWSR